MAVMTLNDGSMWEPSEEQVNKWIGLYPAVSVAQELNAMVGWIDANPKRRKTKRGISTFCNSWLARAQDKGGQGMAKKQSVPGQCKTRDMTMTDDLSQLLIDTPQMREHLLTRFGQYFHNGERHTA